MRKVRRLWRYGPFFAALAILSSAARAERPPPLGNVTLELGAFTGLLNETAGEHVYYQKNLPDGLRHLQGRHLSRLDWRTDHAPIFGVEAVIRLHPRMTLRGRGWATVRDPHGRMTDRDWAYRLFGIEEWTDRSTSDVTKGSARAIDLSGAYTVHASEHVSVDLIAGYKTKTSKWYASGGRYIYSPPPEVVAEALDAGDISLDQVAGLLRSYSGDFPDQNGVIYKQQWRAPYLGAGLRYQQGRFIFSAQAQVSAWAHGKDHDDHLLRETAFDGRGERSKFVGATLQAEYRVTPNWSLTAGLNYEKYFTAQGDLSVANMEGRNVFTDAAGLDNASTQLTLGAKVNF